VPYEPPVTELFLSSFQHGFEVHLPAAGSLRARYCAAGMDAGKATDTLFDEQPTVDRYLLALWPAAPEPERIVRQTSELAGYWHRHAQATPPRRVAPIEPPAGLRPPPIELLKAMHRGEPRDDAFVAGWSADTRRAAARWLARRAFEMAGIDRLDWVRPALAALDRGEPLPAPFTSPAAVFPLLPPGDAGGTEPIHRPSFAVPAIFSAGLPDSRQALAETLRHAEATYHDRREELRRELLERYP
jgi:hypothetical protein